MLSLLLLPLVLALPVWGWRYSVGSVLWLSQREATLPRAFGDYCLSYLLLTILFVATAQSPSFKSCFLLTESHCETPIATALGELGFGFAFFALPLGAPIGLYAVWETGRRIRAKSAKSHD